MDWVCAEDTPVLGVLPDAHSFASKTHLTI